MLSAAVASSSPFERLESRTLMSAGGLTGQYFDRPDFTKPRMTRVDPQINFDWDRGSPDASLSKNRNSIRWTGELQAAKTGMHTIHATANDRIRVFINGERIINAWEGNGRHYRKADLHLDAGERYDIRIDYRERLRKSMVKLEWSTPNMAQTTIPASALFSEEEPVTRLPPQPQEPVGEAPTEDPVVILPPLAPPSEPVVVQPPADPVQPVDPVQPPAPQPQSPIYNFSLINADTDQVIAGYESLSDGVTLNFSTLPTRNLNIRANGTNDVLGVRFNYDGATPFPVQHYAPFAMADNLGSNYYAWTPTTGAHVLIATPYGNHDATGTPVGTDAVLNFVVVE